jgi:two-component system, OmpR family, sensor kinase
VHSLRFRVPAIFLAGIMLAALVTGGFALQLFLDYNEDKTLNDLRRQAEGLAELYATQALQSVEEGRSSPRFAAPLLEEASGTRLYYAGVEIFPGQISGLRRLDRNVLDWEMVEAGEVQTLQFEPPGTDRLYLAAAHPIELGGETFGALVVAEPRAELHDSFMALISRLGLAFLGGLVAAFALVIYLSRSVTRPLRALSRAADQVAAGRYDAKLPRSRYDDEVGHLTDRFREMTDRLAESQRRERTFLMVVSHELRTPVTAIRGHIEALREGLAEDADARDASLEVIRAESDRLARLVGDVLDLARLDARQFTLEEDEVEMQRLVEQAYQAFSEEARRRGIEYEHTVRAEPVIHTDGDRVLQIVSNLLGNAFAWTPDGGKVQLTLAAGNGTVSVSVADSGPGISREERERIFRPFYSRDGGGTGLGLPIARGLARALGGELRLQSELGQGSRFELRLPAS